MNKDALITFHDVAAGYDGKPIVSHVSLKGHFPHSNIVESPKRAIEQYIPIEHNHHNTYEVAIICDIPE